ncbi:hypothetical protein V2O64_20655 [Verrucomicrobiaceae bacterium 227]
MNSIRIITAPRAPHFEDLQTLGQSIPSDWFGQSLTIPTRVLFWIADERLHFLAHASQGPGQHHPDSRPSQYHAELWKYDVAEFFLLDPRTGQYLEFNLAPNGAWWSCGFSSPRTPSPGEPTAIPDLETHTRQEDRSWSAHASLPLAWLREHYHFGEPSKINATLILRSPDQIFLTAAAPPGGAPDFHRPDQFLKVEFTALA